MSLKCKVILVLFFLPMLAFANAGSPLLWFGLFHLSILNAFIGGIESVIIRKFNIAHSMFLILIANYTSLFVGLVLIGPYFSKLAENVGFLGNHTSNGYNNENGLIWGLAASFVATILIEFPFYYYSVTNRSEKSIQIKPFLIANITTNIVMVFIYYLLGSVG